jgi:uncharacterized membrane protein YfcA
MDFLRFTPIVIWIVLAVTGLWFAAYFFRDYRRKSEENGKTKWPHSIVIGFVVNFFDTLGVGSFAPATALLKATRQADDRLLPGILNVGCCLPVILQALIFIQNVEVDPLTLAGMMCASALGAFLGVDIATRISAQKIRLFMGMGLLATSGLMFASLMEWMAVGGTEHGLEGGRLLFAIAANFVLGTCMTAGVGLYAPCMALVFLLGLSPMAAFPIMMGSCAILMPIASCHFIKENAYNCRTSMAITLGGLAGVAGAAFIVVSLDIYALRWLIVGVLLYTSAVMLHAYAKNKRLGQQGAPQAATKSEQ